MTTTSNDSTSTVEPVAAVANGGDNGPAATLPAKLHGRAFYESIGSPKFVLAPMVDQSEFAWRLLSRSFMTPESNGKLVAYTPMLHARMFQEMPRFRDRMFQPLRASLATAPAPPFLPADLHLDGNPAVDRPLFVQFCANDPGELLAAARYVAPFCDAVDLNLGCPQGIAKRGNYGAFLQEDQELIFKLINTLHQNLPVPVTAKIRILETREKTLAYAKNVLSAGASILTVHGRQREQKGHKTGLADWSVIRYLRENLPAETVLFANGNILQRADIDACLEATGVDGVMSAEGNLYDPAIFAEAPEPGQEGRFYWRGNDGKGGFRMDAVFRRYMDIIHKHVLEQPVPDRKPLYVPSDPELPQQNVSDAEDEGPPKKKQKRTGKTEKVTSPSLTAMQAHLFHLLRALVGKQHHIRDALAKSRAGDIAAYENVLHLVEVACAKGIKEYADTHGKSWGDEVVRDELAKAKKEEEARSLREIHQGKGNDGKDAAPEGDAEVDESSVETVRQCRRPWWVVQPYVRPLPKEALMKGSLTLSKKERRALEIENVEKGKVRGGDGEEVADAGGDGVQGAGVEVEKVGERQKEEKEVEVPKEGLVCG